VPLFGNRSGDWPRLLPTEIDISCAGIK